MDHSASAFKKLICVILAASALTTASTVTAFADETENEVAVITAETADTADSGDEAATNDSPKPGDVDGDGVVTSNDALLILRHSIELEKLDESVLHLADMDGDGYVTSADALAALKEYIGEPDPVVVIPSQYLANCGERIDLHPTLSPAIGLDKVQFTYEIFENSISTDGLTDATKTATRTTFLNSPTQA